MSVSFRFDVDLTAASRAFASLRAANQDLRPLLHTIGNDNVENTVERFDTNVAPDGTAWPQSLRAKEKGGRTLVLSGQLRDSFDYFVDGDSAVEWGSNREYARIHQLGGTITPKGAGALKFTLATGDFVMAQKVTIPARPYLGLSVADAGQVGERAVEYWQAAMDGGAA